MPGILDASRPKASYISSWAIYRAAVAASDDLAHPENVTSIIDLTTSFNGVDAEIWIMPVLASGTGTVDMAVILANNGSLQALQPYATAASEMAVGNQSLQKFSGLVAGQYRVLLTLSATASWDLHFAVVSRAASAASAGGGGGGGGAGGAAVYSGTWANPNGNIVPTDPTVTAFYGQDSSGTVNFWQWSVTNQNWFSIITT